MNLQGLMRFVKRILAMSILFTFSINRREEVNCIVPVPLVSSPCLITSLVKLQRPDNNQSYPPAKHNTHTHTLTHSHIRTHAHKHTYAFSNIWNTYNHVIYVNFLFMYITHTHIHSHTHSLTLSHTCTHTHTHTYIYINVCVCVCVPCVLYNYTYYSYPGCACKPSIGGSKYWP